MKLVMSTLPVHQNCKICEKIHTKLRRRKKEVDNVNRWQREGGRSASIDVAMENIKHLDQEIYALNYERTRRLQTVGGR